VASKNSSDWKQADRDILPELDRASHLYIEQKQNWRRPNALDDVRNEPRSPRKPHRGKLSEPKPVAETTYVTFYNDATVRQNSRDEEAAQKWRDIAEILLNPRRPRPYRGKGCRGAGTRNARWHRSTAKNG